MRYALLLLAVLATSGSAFFVREADLHPVLLASYRQLIAALVLSPIFIALLRKHREISVFKLFRAVIPPAVLLSAELSVWNVAARSTEMANASLLINLMPLAMPFVLFMLYRERISGRETKATVIALAGLLLLVSADIATSSFLGDGLALTAMVMLTIYLTMARRFSEVPSIWLYVVPMYTVGGLGAGFVGLFMADSYIPTGTAGWWPVLGLALLSTVIGHSLLNRSMQVMRGQTVALVNMLHPVFAGVWGFIAFAEEPSILFYGAAALLMLAAYIVVTGPNKAVLEGLPQVDVLKGRTTKADERVVAPVVTTETLADGIT
jgi:drug/metabolite transporter (DMT)-like permease